MERQTPQNEAVKNATAKGRLNHANLTPQMAVSSHGIAM
jgi:hypothetical protein